MATTTQTFTYGENLTLLSNMWTHTGYQFSVWSTSLDASDVNIQNFNQGQTLSESEYAPYVVDKNIDLFAIWTGNKYAVQFVAENDGHTTGNMANQIFTYGETKALNKCIFRKTGFTFIGWATIEGGSKVYDDQQPVTNLTSEENGIVKLYACFVPSVFKVTLTVNESSDTHNPLIKIPKFNKFYYKYGIPKFYSNEECTIELEKYEDLYKIPDDIPERKYEDFSSYSKENTIIISKGKGTGGFYCIRSEEHIENVASDQVLVAKFIGKQIRYGLAAKWGCGYSPNYCPLPAHMGLHNRTASQLTGNNWVLGVFVVRYGEKLLIPPTKGDIYTSFSNGIRNENGSPWFIFAPGFDLLGWCTKYPKNVRDSSQHGLEGFDWPHTDASSFEYGVPYTNEDYYPKDHGYIDIDGEWLDRNAILNDGHYIDRAGWWAKGSYCFILYAVYQKRGFKVVFNANGGTGEVPSDIEWDAFYHNASYGTKLIENKVPTREGYEFLGWGRYAASTRVEFESGKDYSCPAFHQCGNPNIEFDDNFSEITLYAIWKIKGFIVDYNANGGTGTMGSHNVNYNTVITLSNNGFKRTGYTFKGWTCSLDGNTYPEGYSYRVTNNATFSAIWELMKFNITFDANGGEGTMPSQTVEYGTEVTLNKNKFTKRGFSFKNWLWQETNIIFNNECTYTHNYLNGFKLIAQWEAIDYIWTFKLNKDDTNGVPYTVNCLEPFTFPKSDILSIPEGYSFIEWKKENPTEGEKNTFKPGHIIKEPVGTQSFYAGIDKIQCDLIIDPNHDNEPTYTVGTYDYGTEIGLFTLSNLPCYEFDGWLILNDTNQWEDFNTESIVITKTTYLKAKWKAKSFMVDYAYLEDPNNPNSDLVAATAYDFKYGSKETIYDYPLWNEVLPNWTFVNWICEEDGKEYSPGEELIFNFNKDIRFIANLKPKTFNLTLKSNINTIYFKANGGTGEKPSVYIEDHETYTLEPSNAPTRIGFDIDNWNRKADGTSDAHYYWKNSEIKNLNGDINLYAIWKALSFKWTFKANNNTNKAWSIDYTYESECVIPDPSTLGFTAPSGMEFDYWQIEDNPTYHNYVIGEKYYKQSNNLTFIAIWSPITLKESNIQYNAYNSKDKFKFYPGACNTHLNYQVSRGFFAWRYIALGIDTSTSHYNSGYPISLSTNWDNEIVDHLDIAISQTCNNVVEEYQVYSAGSLCSPAGWTYCRRNLSYTCGCGGAILDYCELDSLKILITKVVINPFIYTNGYTASKLWCWCDKAVTNGNVALDSVHNTSSKMFSKFEACNTTGGLKRYGRGSAFKVIMEINNNGTIINKAVDAIAEDVNGWASFTNNDAIRTARLNFDFKNKLIGLEKNAFTTKITFRCGNFCMPLHGIKFYKM